MTLLSLSQHDEDDVIMGHMASSAYDVISDQGGGLTGGGPVVGGQAAAGGGSVDGTGDHHSHQQQQQQLQYSSSSSISSSSNGGGGGVGGGPPPHRLGSQGFSSLLDTKTLEAAIGSLPGVGGGSHSTSQHHHSLHSINHQTPMSPSSSGHSSVGYYYGASSGGVGGVSGGVLGMGLAGMLGNLRHPEHTLRGWLDGTH